MRHHRGVLILLLLFSLRKRLRHPTDCVDVKYANFTRKYGGSGGLVCAQFHFFSTHRAHLLTTVTRAYTLNALLSFDQI